MAQTRFRTIGFMGGAQTYVDTFCTIEEALAYGAVLVGTNDADLYRIFQKQRGKWHKVYDSEHGY